MDMTKEMAKYIMEITVELQKARMILKTIVKKLLLPLFGIGRHITRLLVTLICEFSARSCLIEWGYHDKGGGPAKNYMRRAC